MSPKERKAVAKTLREWAAWCEANPELYWWENSLDAVKHSWKIMCIFCDGPSGQFHKGPTAATGLLLAAAMVEAGDEA